MMIQCHKLACRNRSAPRRHLGGERRTAKPDEAAPGGRRWLSGGGDLHMDQAGN
jgi:hypothetical protein